MTNKIVISLDTETFPMGPDAIAPKVVCASLAGRGTDNKLETQLVTNGDGKEPFETMRVLLKGLFTNAEYRIVGHTICYDLACIVTSLPEFHSPIWKALDGQRITDTKIREQLLNLSTHGNIRHIITPDKKKIVFLYDLETLSRNRLGYDRSKVKKGDDIWRLRYNELDTLPIESYPREAIDYAINDATDTLEVYEDQKACEQSPQGGPGSMRTQEFHTAVEFALKLMTVRGILTDRSKVESLLNILNEELNPQNLPLLVESGILVPGKPAEPYKRDPTRFKIPQPERLNTKKLKALVEAVCEQENIPVQKTTKDNTVTDASVLNELAEFDATLKQLQLRQKVNRLRTTELPKMLEGKVHPEYGVLKETGRTSSFMNNLFPSNNIQQADPRTRDCYVPRDGYAFCSIDYDAIELCSLAQKTYKLFGYSVHRDLINEGVDLHAYLAAQLAYHFSHDFRDTCNAVTGVCGPMGHYELFLKCKKTDKPFFKKWRTFAKPTGLGFPGGLGAATFVDYAKATFGVEVTEDEAVAMKDLWLQTYPEMEDYFKWINTKCQDSLNISKFCYSTPMKMYRAGTSFCAAANGAGLQSPTAEGAKGAVFKVSRCCYDPGMKSILYQKVFPIIFLHDEIISEIKIDEHMHERAYEKSKIMNNTMQRVLPDVKVTSSPALMMWWDKRAETVFDANGRLTIWRPDDEKG